MEFNQFLLAKLQEPEPLDKICNIPSVLKSTGNIPASAWRDCLAFLATKFLAFLYGLALALGVVFIIWAGILYITRGGSEEKIKAVHKKLFYATLGLIIAISARAIITLIKIFFESLNR